MPRRKPKYDPHDYGAIRGVWETLADVKVRYSADETGWAKQLSAGTVCIANLPMADELMFLDICSCADLDGRSGEDLPEVGCVLKAYYAQRAGVRYSVADEGGADLPRRYQAFARAIETVSSAAAAKFTVPSTRQLLRRSLGAAR